MTQSYSAALIRMILNSYVDICTGSLSNVLDNCRDFTQSRGRRNPQESCACWKVDIDMAINALCKKSDFWEKEATDITPPRLIQISRSNQINGWQRRIISLCILHDCEQGDCDAQHRWRPVSCPNWSVIGEMKRMLNNQLIKSQPRDDFGRFSDTRNELASREAIDKQKEGA